MKLDWPDSEYGVVVASCECGNEPSGNIKCRESLAQLRDS